MIIGLWAPKGAGKSTAARILAECHGFTEVSFADPLKELVHKLFDWPREVLWGPSEGKEVVDTSFAYQERWHSVGDRLALYYPDVLDLFSEAPTHPSDRAVLLLIKEVLDKLWMRSVADGGIAPRFVLQHLGTEFGRHLWTDVWVHNAIKRATAPRVVLSDVRFENEAKTIHSLGGSVVWIDAALRGVREAAGGHASESRLEDVRHLIDFVLDNNSSFENLEFGLATIVDIVAGDLPAGGF